MKHVGLRLRKPRANGDARANSGRRMRAKEVDGSLSKNVAYLSSSVGGLRCLAQTAEMRNRALPTSNITNTWEEPRGPGTRLARSTLRGSTRSLRCQEKKKLISGERHGEEAKDKRRRASWSTSGEDGLVVRCKHPEIQAQLAMWGKDSVCRRLCITSPRCCRRNVNGCEG